jgi:predicted Fe-Mo cluster-binding NifX family protein
MFFMKIAVTSTGPTIDDQVEARFGRAPYFLVVDPETMAVEPLENPNIALGGGAGIQSAQMLAEKGVQAILTGNCGPNAFQTFGAAGIQVITGITGPVRKAVERFKAGELFPTSNPSVQSHFGIGRGMGIGGRMGGGRSMAGGRIADPSGAGSSSQKEEIARLRKRADEMRKQIESIESRLRQIEDT